jgi:hypothetical protein
MKAILGKWSEEIYVVLRFMMGFMIGCHGVQKVSVSWTERARLTAYFSSRV